MNAPERREDRRPGPPDDFDLGQLDRDSLLAVARAYCRLYQALDGLWYLSIMERYGNDVALELDEWVWSRLPKFESRHLAPPLGVEGKRDLASFMKLFLLTPINVLTEFRFESFTEDECVIVFTSCPILEALEKEGKGRERDICQHIDPIIFRAYARYFNPDVEATPLKVPPRQGRDEVPCRWRFRLKKP